MTDLEISKALALAIGWEKDQMCVHNRSFYVTDWPRKDNRKTLLLGSGRYPPPLTPWRKFDHMDWAVIGPIAEKFDLFPRKSETLGWWLPHIYAKGFHTTPQKAIASAVIGAKK